MQTGEDSVLDRNATEDLKEPVGASGSSVEDEVEDYPSEKEEFASEDESSHGILAAAVAVTISPYSSCSGSEADYDFSDSTDSSTPRTPKRRRDRAAEDTVRELLLDQVAEGLAQQAQLHEHLEDHQDAVKSLNERFEAMKAHYISTEDDNIRLRSERAWLCMASLAIDAAREQKGVSTPLPPGDPGQSPSF